MNQQKNYFLKIIILPSLFAFSLSIATFESHEEQLKKITQLTTVAAVDDEIDSIKNNINKEYLTELACTTNKSYEYLEKTVVNERAIIKRYLQRRGPRILHRHDKNIPSSMYQDLCTSASEEKINPNNITMTYLPNPILRKNLLASATCFGSQINMYHALSEELKASLLFTLKHELYHVLLRHHWINSFANAYTSNIDKLISISEREADIHAASKNTLIAHAGTEQRCLRGHVGIIDGESHCYQMQIMYALMQQKEKLS